MFITSANREIRTLLFNTNSMKLSGLKLDYRFKNLPVGAWIDANDILITNEEVHNDRNDSDIVINNTETIVHVHTIAEHLIYFKYNSANPIVSSIVVTKNNITLKTISSLYFYFEQYYNSTTFESIHTINNKGEITIIWTDRVTPMKAINLGRCESVEADVSLNQDEVKALDFFKSFHDANIDIDDIGNNGSLLSGVYYAAICYEIEKNVETSYGHVSSPIYIIKNDDKTSYDSIIGCPSGIETSKAIKFKFANLDTNYKFIKLGIIYRNLGAITAYESERIKIVNGNATFTLDTIGKLTQISPSKIVVHNQTYDRVGSLTVVNDRLRLADVENSERIALNYIYDNILPHFKVRWFSDTVSLSNSINSHKNGKILFYKKGFRPDEVYAFYLGFHKPTGGKYGIYHIPGRVANAGDTDNITIFDGPENIIAKKYLLGRTATCDNIADPSTTPRHGNMGYWENQNEIYPTEFGSIANSKVRHHKFPSIKDLFYWGLDNPYSKGNIQETTQYTESKIGIDVATGNCYYKISPNYNPSKGSVTYSNSGITNITNDIMTYTATDNQYIKLSLTISCCINSITSVSSTSFFEFGIIHIIDSVTHVNLNFELEESPTNGWVYVRGNDNQIYKYQITTNANGTYCIVLEGSINDVFLKKGQRIQLSAFHNSIVGNNPIDSANINYTLDIESYDISIDYPTLGVEVSCDYIGLQNELTTGSVAKQQAVKKFLDQTNAIELFYAKRTFDNATIIDQSLVLKDGGYNRFYGFDSMANLLNIIPTHAIAELEADVIGGDSNHVDILKLKENFGSRLVTKIKEIRYLPANNSATSPSNEGRENCYLFKSNQIFDYKRVNLFILRDDVYKDFSNKELVSTGVISLMSKFSIVNITGNGTTATFYFNQPHNLVTGDWLNITASIAGYNGIHRVTKIDDNTVTFASTTTGVASVLQAEKLLLSFGGDTSVSRYTYLAKYNNATWQAFTCATESISTIGYRYEGENLYEKIFPNTNVFETKEGVQIYLDAMLAANAVNNYIYNNEFNVLDNIKQDIIIDELVSTDYKFPNRIPSSIVQPNEVSSLVWRIFRPGDYYDMPTNKGKIIKIIGTDNVMFIQCENTLFKANVTDRLITDNVNAYLKTTDVFDQRPEELYTERNNFISIADPNHSVLTPIGYVLVDIKSADIHIIGEEVTTITNTDITKTFKRIVSDYIDDQLKGLSNTTKGIGIGYDKDNGEILFSFETTNYNSGRLSAFTISYSFKYGFWTSYRSIHYPRYIWNINGLYGIKATAIKGIRKGNYNGLNPYIDFQYGNTENADFLINNIQWISKHETNGNVAWDKTIPSLLLYTKHQSTVIFNIVRETLTYDGSNNLVNTGNAKYWDGVWTFNDVWDALINPNAPSVNDNGTFLTNTVYAENSSLIDWSNKSKIITKFAVIRLILTTSLNEKITINKLVLNGSPTV